MPADRRAFTATKPVKTERTHEENQERAYIAASRRSDRSLEARIESARRASEIHKKRTGRALRVTEQDVINEEMYEEEDDDLPTQYQRLNAHLQTTSVMFNKKLHDYIATQHGVRNMFMSQYQNPSYSQVGGQFQPNSGSAAQPNNWLNPSMLPPQPFSPNTSQTFQQAQPYSPTGTQQQGYRRAPYHVPQRPQSHQRSFSIQMPPATNFDAAVQQPSMGTATPEGGVSRRMSLPAHAFEHSSQSRSPTAQPITQRQSMSPQMGSSAAGSVHESAQDTPTSATYSPTSYPYSSQALNTNPLTFTLPPESQQLIGSALDPNDPRTAMFMSGSEHLPQPFAPTYTYNPNLSKSRAANAMNGNDDFAGSAQTLSSGLSLKMENGAESASMVPSSMGDGLYANDSFLASENGDFGAFFDMQSTDFTNNEGSGTNDQLDGNNFVNWD